MRFSLKSCLVSMLTGAITLVAGQALAVSGPGATMKNANSKDNSCLSASNYGAITNYCSYPVTVIGSLPVSEGLYSTSVSLFGNNSSCNTQSTNVFGNSYSLGSDVFTQAGPQHWETLNLGNRYVLYNTTLIYSCNLESGGIIGNFIAVPA